MERVIELIARLPRPTLADLIGHDVVRAITEIQPVQTKADLARLLIDFRGRSTFLVKGLLPALAYQLDGTDLEELSERGMTDPKLEISNIKWGQNSTCQLFCDWLGVSVDEFLPEELELEEYPDVEKVNPLIDGRITDRDGQPVRIYPLHDYQKRVKDEFVQLLLEPRSRFLIHMPTGSGKTKTAIEGLVDFWRTRGQDQGLIVWLAHTKELCAQSRETFIHLWQARGDVSIDVASIFESHSPSLTDLKSAICFVGFQKLHSLIQSGSDIALGLRDRTRVVVVDEAHKALAPTYLRCINYLADNANTRLVGLTATPGRGGDFTENEQFSKFFNSTAFRLRYPEVDYRSAIDYLQQNGYLAKLRLVKIDSRVTFTQEELGRIDVNSVDLPEVLLARLSEDANRNIRIISEIKAAVKSRGDPTLVFATSVAHTAILKFLLAKEGIESESVLGETPSAVRANAIKRFKASKLPVLINYGVLTTGFDAPNLGTLVIARPTSSVILYSQMLGRALRGPKMGGANQVNTIVDLIDNGGRFGDEHSAFQHFLDFFAED